MAGKVRPKALEPPEGPSFCHHVISLRTEEAEVEEEGEVMDLQGTHTQPPELLISDDEQATDFDKPPLMQEDIDFRMPHETTNNWRTSWIWGSE